MSTTTPQRPALALFWVGRVLGVLLAAAVAGALAVTIVIPRLVDGTSMNVLTGSMTPTIPVGSMVVVRPVDPGTLRVGDVATYQVEPGKPVFITHRIVEIDRSTSPASFVFKGDANRGHDSDPVPPGAIRGEVWFHVPYVGMLKEAVSGVQGAMLLGMVLLGGYAISQLTAGVREARLRRTSSSARVDRPLATVTFDPLAVEATTGLSVPHAVQLMHGLVLRHSPDEVVVLVAIDDVQTLDLLETLRPTSVIPIDGARPLSGANPGDALSETIARLNTPREVGQHVPQ
jgi:signal peptidase